MLGPGLGSVFASRWKALWWAAGVLLTAYCSVPSQQEAKQDKSEQEATEKALRQVSQQLDPGGGENPD